MSAHLYGNVYIPVGVARALADSSDFGPLGLGKQSSQKWEIPCLRRQWTAEQNLTWLALSSAEKYVAVQTNTHTHKQTVTDISTPCSSACVDNKTVEKGSGITYRLNDLVFLNVADSFVVASNAIFF